MQKAMQKDVYQAMKELQKRQDKVEQDYKKLHQLISQTVISYEKISPFITKDMSSDTSQAMNGLVNLIRSSGSQIGAAMRELISDKQDTFLYGHLTPSSDNGHLVQGSISYENTGTNEDEKLKRIHGDMYVAENGDILIIHDGVCSQRYNSHSSCDFDFRVLGRELSNVHVRGCSDVSFPSNSPLKNITLIDCDNISVQGENISLIGCRDMIVDVNDVSCERCENCDIHHGRVDIAGVSGYVIQQDLKFIPETDDQEANYELGTQRITQVYEQQDYNNEEKDALYASLFNNDYLSNTSLVSYYSVKIGYKKI